MSNTNNTNDTKLNDLHDLPTKTLCGRRNCKNCSMTDCCGGYDKRISTNNTSTVTEVTQ